VDTIKEVERNMVVTKTVDRSKLWAVQTPQSFRLDLINKAYKEVGKKKLMVTDEASAVEALGEKVYLVPASSSNIKITAPEDLTLAAMILKV
jgi:2-C-methyl-D-erythritol 4-phosphate cytidylyltransferase